MTTSIVYRLTCKVNNKMYIGVTNKNLNYRWKQHCREAQNGSKCRLHQSIRKYGPDKFIQEIIYCSLDYNHILEMEQYFIKYYNTFYRNGKGFNMTKGGQGTIGRKKSKEQKTKEQLYWTLENRSKQAKKVTGPKNGMYKKKHTPEALAKCVKHGKDHPFFGKHHSEKAKEKNRKAHLGKKASKETKEKLIKAKEKYQFTLLDPKGTEYTTKNFNQFRREIGLPYPMTLGKPISRGPNKGWILISKILLLNQPEKVEVP
jgi:group I intron endonuclease